MGVDLAYKTKEPNKVVVATANAAPHLDVMKKKLSPLLLLLFTFIGCSDHSKLSLSGLTDTNATAIAISVDGDIVDFVHISPNSNIDWIEFHAPENGDEIRVIVIGPEVHPDLPPGVIVSSKVAEGFIGRVKVDIEGDLITGIYGNTISYKNSPISMEHLMDIKDKINIKNRKYSASTIIVNKNKYLTDLIEDSEGNLFPSNITPEEKGFLNTIVPALKNRDIKMLSSYVHKDVDDKSRINTVRDFLEFVTENKIHYYQFIQIDSSHPDNKSIFVDMDGDMHRHSLTPKWILTVFFTPKNSSGVNSANLIVGDNNGKLMFPTKYAN